VETPSGWDTFTLKVCAPRIAVPLAGDNHSILTEASPVWHFPLAAQWYPVGQLRSDAQEMVSLKSFVHPRRR
jgi:hypothetical protein